MELPGRDGVLRRRTITDVRATVQPRPSILSAASGEWDTDSILGPACGPFGRRFVRRVVHEIMRPSAWEARTTIALTLLRALALEDQGEDKSED